MMSFWIDSSTYYSSIYTIPGYYNINLYMIDTITGCNSNISQDLFWGSNHCLDFHRGNNVDKKISAEWRRGSVLGP